MSNSCEACDRPFVNDHALQQHLRDSPVHQRTFSSNEAPLQHRRDSVIPIPTFSCETCNKSFGSNQALQQHLQNSPVHKPTFKCETCDISFRSDEALQEHLRESIVHNPTFNCAACKESFRSEEDLNQHMQTSPVHSHPPSWCGTCERSFRNDEALQQHLRDSRIHRIEGQHQDIETEPKPYEMFPELHRKVLEAISGAMNPPRFTHKNSDDGATNLKETNAMGKFECNNHPRTRIWPSKIVTTVIRKYPGNEYSVVVYKQRCRSCNELGTLFLDEDSYVERVAYRLKKWAGVPMEIPPYEKKEGRPHKRELCEGCKAGHCQEKDLEEEDSEEEGSEEEDWDVGGSGRRIGRPKYV
jgi:hypothetical protein